MSEIKTAGQRSVREDKWLIIIIKMDKMQVNKSLTSKSYKWRIIGFFAFLIIAILFLTLGFGKQFWLSYYV